MTKISYLLIIGLFSVACANERRENPISKEENNQFPIQNDSKSSEDLTTINFYLENSGSMNPYTKGNTNFNRSIVNLLRDIELLSLCEINLFAVNTEIYTLNQNLDEFITTFNKNGIPSLGNTGDSDLNKIFENVLNNHTNGAISILITDAIYSVKGSKEKILQNLDTEVFKTRNEFINTLRKKDLGTLCLKLTSNYNGFYYPAVGGSISINQDRPYYIWIFGNNHLLKNFNIKAKVFDFPGLTDYFFSLKHEGAPTKYTILEYGIGVIGDYRNEKTATYPVHTIIRSNTSTRPDTRGQFGFAVAVDLSQIPLPGKNLLDKSNYRLTSNEYEIYDVVKIDKNLPFKASENIERIKSSQGDISYTHILLLKTNQKHLQSFEIELHNDVPRWVEKTGVDDDTEIIGDTTQTFGFNRLTKGIIDAYKNVNESSKIFSIKVNIK
ncbi:MAG: hypothetical protein H0X62_10090 [Bacteroidetes bacterium]|nr:hypothetical protein [Bacteroidota bacterium]